MSSRCLSLLALSTGPEASAAAQEIIQSADGTQMHANSCAHTQIRLQLPQELFANAGYHLNHHYSALVTTAGWSIWLSMRPAAQAVLETNRTLSQHQVTAMCFFSLGVGYPKVGCGNRIILMENDIEIPLGEEKNSNKCHTIQHILCMEDQECRHKIREHSIQHLLLGPLPCAWERGTQGWRCRLVSGL